MLYILGDQLIAQLTAGIIDHRQCMLALIGRLRGIADRGRIAGRVIGHIPADQRQRDEGQQGDEPAFTSTHIDNPWA